MATHSSILAWRIPWTEEPGGLKSMGSQRVRVGRGDCTHAYSVAKVPFPWHLVFIVIVTFSI